VIRLRDVGRMRGILDITFPSMLSQIRGNRKHVMRLKDSTLLSDSSSQSPSIGTRRLPRGQDAFSKYIKVLRREAQMKHDLPQWRCFKPQKVSLRVHRDWLDHIQHTRSLIQFIEKLFLSRTPSQDKCISSERSVIPEIVISADDLLYLESYTQILTFPVVVISDLSLHNKKPMWRNVEESTLMGQKNALLGFELQSARYRANRAAFREQLRAVSLAQPHFLRIVQRRSTEVRCPVLFSPEELLNSLSRDVAAFARLGYEPVAACSHSLILSRCFERPIVQIELPDVVLGLGIGAESYRLDRSKRPVLFRNPCEITEYYRRDQKYYQNRNQFRNASRITEINTYIDHQFRYKRGLSYEAVERLFGIDLEVLHPGLSAVMQEAGLMTEEGRYLRISSDSRRYVDQVARNFFLQEKDITRMSARSSAKDTSTEAKTVNS